MKLLRAIPNRSKHAPHKDFAEGIMDAFYGKAVCSRKVLEIFNALLGRWKLDEGETIAEALKPMISNVLDARALPCKLATAVVSSPSRYFI